jgi:hypothetical protein
MLSYSYSGAGRIQEALATNADLACTSGTGIIPLCIAAAEAWRRIESQSGQATSRLALSSIRALVTTQVTAILAAAGKTRWCELSTVAPTAVEPFLQVFPHAAFVCVHRHCLDVIHTSIQANPWGLQGQGMAPYLMSYPGNNVAALAARWSDATEDLLTFERANTRITHRVRYEDIAAGHREALTVLRVSLGLGDKTAAVTSPEPPEPPQLPVPAVPAEMIPPPLRQNINRMHAELNYPPLAG